MSAPRAQTLRDVVLLGLMAAAVVAVAADLGPVRPYVVLAAVCLVPGGALLTRLRTGELLTDLALAFGLSFAVEILAGVLLAWSRWWHPFALAILFGAGSAALLVNDIVRHARS